MEPVNQRALLPFLWEFKKRLPQKDIWCYTGYTLETDLQSPSGRARCEATDEMLALIDVLVDGEFILAQKDAFVGPGGHRTAAVAAGWNSGGK